MSWKFARRAPAGKFIIESGKHRRFMKKDGSQIIFLKIMNSQSGTRPVTSVIDCILFWGFLYVCAYVCAYECLSVRVKVYMC